VDAALAVASDSAVPAAAVMVSPLTVEMTARKKATLSRRFRKEAAL
jgi:hypothetical protein